MRHLNKTNSMSHLNRTLSSTGRFRCFFCSKLNASSKSHEPNKSSERHDLNMASKCHELHESSKYNTELNRDGSIQVFFFAKNSACHPNLSNRMSHGKSHELKVASTYRAELKYHELNGLRLNPRSALVIVVLALHA